jgi:hypothetical protein
LASMAHRVAQGLVGGCALLLGVTVSGCGAPQYTYVANSSESTYFKVPYGWHQIGTTALNNIVQQVMGGVAGWQVAYEAGPHPSGSDFLAFNASHPFVFAEVGELNSTASQSLSYDTLRDFFLPVSSTAQSNLQEEYAQDKRTDPFTDFKSIRDEQLTPGQGVHGVRETFDYTLADGGPTDTFDEIALTNADQTIVYFLVLHCTTSCYNSNQAAINDVMTSFTVRSSS